MNDQDRAEGERLTFEETAVFRAAIAAGWIDRHPVDPTRSPRHEVARSRDTEWIEVKTA